MRFPNLFQPYTLKSMTLKNRIFITGHDTYLPEAGLPSDAYVAYQRARAKGGAGLIIVQVVGVHETARYTDALLMGADDDCIPSFRRLIETIHAEGAKVLIQLFHPGREVVGRPEGVAQAAFAPSFSPAERFRTAPAPMTTDLIGEIVEGFAATAGRMAEAGADGVEIVGSHGYLPAQFWSSKVNRREDRYGGSFERRLAFPREVIAAIRGRVPKDMIVGMRMSGDEASDTDIGEEESFAVARALAPELDYLNVIAGTSATASGALHIVPAMHVANAYVAPFAAKVKQATGKPVLVAGRINQPHDAEKVLVEGAADLVGMTRATIADPEMPNKAREGRVEDIRACIACNQACIGHFQLGLSISCIQYPETGRELQYETKIRAQKLKRILVAGGGPAGLKAAAVAAERGHHVTLYEKDRQLGGQVLLAQLLPERAEFGGIVTNLTRDAERAGVKIVKGTVVTRDLIAAEKPDAIVVATGSRLARPPIEAEEGAVIVHAADVLAGRAKTGSSVVIYDWLVDWIGVGMAEKLAREGARVRLCYNGPYAGAAMQNYVRDYKIGVLFKLGVEMIPYMRLYGYDGDTVYFQHTAARAPHVIEGVDTVVLACPGEPNAELAADAKVLGMPCHTIGDAVAARTCEEAVYEGLKVGCEL
jgi:2,4-dienoyl-CoA reductase-like NADH-dependent reductase (Old Yellow Enzyme family)